jgi:membrane protein required for colicin V production
MNVTDWIIMTIMMLSVFLAASQGFFFEVISLAGAVVGYLLAAWGYGRIAPWFMPYVKSEAIADLAGFLAIFLAVVLLAGAIARIARWAMKEVGLRWVDRFLGGAFGLLRGVVIVTVGVMAVTAFAPDSPQLAGSQLAGYFLVAGRGASWLAPSAVRQKFRDGVMQVRQAADRQASGPADRKHK